MRSSPRLVISRVMSSPPTVGRATTKTSPERSMNKCINGSGIFGAVIATLLISRATSADAASPGGIRNYVDFDIPGWENSFQSWLDVFNKEYVIIKHEEAEAAWDTSINITEANQERLKAIQQFKQIWRGRWCDDAQSSFLRREPALLSREEKRQLWFMCRGPRYTPTMARRFETTQQELYKIYHATTVCNITSENACEHGEPELARRMETERNPEVLLRIWEGWHDAVGTPRAKELYADMVDVMNAAARNNGYLDVCQAWQEQLDIPGGVEKKAEELYRQVLPLYRLLHAYVRHRLRLHYGRSNIRPQGHIPAHLLGNMWAQTWDSLWDILKPGEFRDASHDQDRRRRREVFANMSVVDMVRSAEDFYTSMGLDPMTPSFWRKSQFTAPRGASRSTPTSCHPSSLDLSSGDDFRMELCGQRTEDTFVTIHHEMGHVQYYMNYAHQPPLFRDGANAAFHEAVGDTIVYAVQSKKHLARLGIEVDPLIPRLLRQALHKVPLIAWSLVVDRWRWAVFQGKTTPDEYNSYWWGLREGIQGVKSPRQNRKNKFDAMAKFHIPDNSPYIPYFFSSFLQLQLFEGLCQKQFGSKANPHECDLYGAGNAGLALRRMLSLGQSRPWPDALEIVAADRDMSATSLLNYYKPLQEWLERLMVKEEIPVGW